MRVDSYDDSAQADEALTLAFFWTPMPRTTVGMELLTTSDTTRATLQLRYSLGGR